MPLVTDHDALEPTAAGQNDHTSDATWRSGRALPILLFGIASLAFLGYLAIGSVEARIWRFNRLYFEDRTVREVWAYMGDHLPAMPGQPIVTALFWISVAVMVITTIAGLWLFLIPADEDPAKHDHRTGAAATHD